MNQGGSVQAILQRLEAAAKVCIALGALTLAAYTWTALLALTKGRQ